MDIETRSAIDSLRADLQGVDDRVTAVEVGLRQEIREEGATTRRHVDVVAESVRDDIRLIAEGLVALDGQLAGLDAKVEGLRGSR